jgi:LVIVD repeat
MKFKIIVFVMLTSMMIVLFTGCAQPNDPATPDAETVYLELQAVYPSEGYVRDIAVTDDYVYVAEDEAGFSIWDNNSDALLTRMRSYDTISGIDTTTTEFTNIKLVAVDQPSNALLVYNRYGSSAGVHLFDITDNSNPDHKYLHTGNISDISQIELTEIDSTQFRFSWLYQGSQNNEYYGGKFLSAGGGAFWTVFGEQVGKFNYDVVGYQEETETDLIYCASKQLGLRIVENPGTIGEFDFTEIGGIDTPGQTLAVKVVDNIAYLGNREEGIQVLDITDINNPIELYNYDTTGLASDIEVNTELNVFALASSSGGIYLFSGPEGEIKRLQRIDDSGIGYVNMIEMRGDLLYVGTRYGVYKYKIVNL